MSMIHVYTCMHVYACLYVYMNVCMRMSIFMCMYMYMWIYMFIQCRCVLLQMYVCMCIIVMYIHEYMRCMQACNDVYVHVL